MVERDSERERLGVVWVAAERWKSSEGSRSEDEDEALKWESLVGTTGASGITVTACSSFSFKVSSFARAVSKRDSRAEFNDFTMGLMTNALAP